LVIGAFVRGLSMRDVESLCEKGRPREALEVHRAADLHRAARALEQFKRRDLYDVHLGRVCSSIAVFLSVRPDGPKEGVLVAWGFTEQGERVLLR